MFGEEYFKWSSRRNMKSENVLFWTVCHLGRWRVGLLLPRGKGECGCHVHLLPERLFKLYKSVVLERRLTEVCIWRVQHLCGIRRPRGESDLIQGERRDEWQDRVL